MCEKSLHVRFLIAVIGTLGLVLFSPEARAQEKLATPPRDSEFLLGEARSLVQQGELLRAKEDYLRFLKANANHPRLPEVQQELEALNMKILFSKTLTSDSFLYEVKSGDTLSKIAKTYGTTVDLLQRVNGLRGATIYPGMKLKVVSARFSIRVDVVAKKLTLLTGELTEISPVRNDNRQLLAGREILKTYPIAVGTDGSTPIGTFEIVNKLENPTWFHAGVVVPPDSPENILGTRWLGFSMPGYGIHGTTLPETIGANVTQGCIRMYNRDVEELYAIVPLGTEVVIEPAQISNLSQRNGGKLAGEPAQISRVEEGNRQMLAPGLPAGRGDKGERNGQTR